jgi:hypothetical protein
MLDKEKAAKMLIVGWVKNWNMRTLLGILDEKSGMVTEERLVEACKQFPFMPSYIGWYISGHGGGAYIRKFTHERYPKLSNALWDTEDNAKKLAFHTYLLTAKAGGLEPGSKFTQKERSEQAKNGRHYKASLAGYRISREIFKKAQRNSWTTVK